MDGVTWTIDPHSRPAGSQWVQSVHVASQDGG